MTNPNLAIATSPCSKTRLDFGRPYQRPGMANPFPAKLRYSQAVEGYLAGLLVPSITTVIGAGGPDLQGWATYMGYKNLAEEVKDPAFWEYIQHEGRLRGNHRFLTSTLQEIGRRSQNAAKEYTAFTASRGTEVHLAAENHLRDGSHPTEWEFAGQGYYEGFLRFMADTSPTVEVIEGTVYGTTPDGLGYAGTMDAVMVINGSRYAVDWKTSKTISKTVAIQLAAGINAQEKATEDETGLEPNLTGFDGALGVQLLPDGGYSIYRCENLEYAWNQFCHLRHYWEWKALGGASGSHAPLTEVSSDQL